MTITIIIKDKDVASDLLAVGAKDLKEHFLPKIGINADKIKITDVSSSLQYYCDEY